MEGNSREDLLEDLRGLNPHARHSIQVTGCYSSWWQRRRARKLMEYHVREINEPLRVSYNMLCLTTFTAKCQHDVYGEYCDCDDCDGAWIPPDHSPGHSYTLDSLVTGPVCFLEKLIRESPCL